MITERIARDYRCSFKRKGSPNPFVILSVTVVGVTENERQTKLKEWARDRYGDFIMTFSPLDPEMKFVVV